VNAPIATGLLSRAGLKRRDWTTCEIALLREHYGENGPSAIRGQLAGRTYNAIAQKAHQLGLKTPAGTYSRKRWPNDEQLDAAIRAVYIQKPERGAIRRFADGLGRPRWWVTHRAAELGLVTPRFKEPAWSKEEMDFLRTNAHREANSLSAMFARRGWRRSPAGVAVKRKRLGLSLEDPDHFTATQLARLCGVDPTYVTKVWILKEGLPASRRGTARVEAQGGDMWWIERGALRRWIAGHAQLIDLRKVDRFWFIDLAFGPA
jgi:hypothetical protein